MHVHQSSNLWLSLSIYKCFVFSNDSWGFILFLCRIHWIIYPLKWKAWLKNPPSCHPQVLWNTGFTSSFSLLLVPFEIWSFFFISGSEDTVTHGEPSRVLPAKDRSHVSNISSLKAVGKKKRAGKMLHVCFLTLCSYWLHSFTYLKWNHEHKRPSNQL